MPVRARCLDTEIAPMLDAQKGKRRHARATILDYYCCGPRRRFASYSSLFYEVPDNLFHFALLRIDQVQQNLAEGATHALKVPLVEVHALKLALRVDVFFVNKKNEIK